MNTGDVKTQLIGALKEMGRDDRVAFFKQHHIAFAKYRAKNFNKHANYFLGRIEKQLNARTSASSFSKPLENWSYNHAQTKDVIAKSFAEFSKILSSREKLNGHLESVKNYFSDINGKLTELFLAGDELCRINKSTKDIHITRNNKYIEVNVENIEKTIFVPFKASLTHSIQELNKLYTKDLTTTDKEKLQNAIDAAKTKAKKSIADFISKAEQSINALCNDGKSYRFDPDNPNKKYIDLINQVKILLLQARALIAIQDFSKFNKLNTSVEVWAIESISRYMFPYNDKSDEDIQYELAQTTILIEQTKNKLLQAIPQQAENKSALTALINALTPQQITEIAALQDDTARLEALNKYLPEGYMEASESDFEHTQSIRTSIGEIKPLEDEDSQK